ncbi:phosphatase PAP2 family protein [uncultured Endozoicomonas sp.]|uniref:phosphatase PAP2 family protein n=1 Tax=uncultured Endozoicomonas sp. TaxID=432652 RepID=UPI0026354D3B|nr:phosphatase PAP2 family protein [uncultured Endozoicomonas sp.]
MKSLKLLYVVMLLTASAKAFPEENKQLHRIGGFLSGNLVHFATIHTLWKESGDQDYEWVNGLVQLHLGHTVSKQLVIPKLKDTFDRERPFGHGNDSFPSGHAGTAFYPAWYIYERYGMADALPYLVGATIAGYARVRNDHHYWSDIAGSALVTYGLNQLFTSSMDNPASPVLGVGFNKDGTWINVGMRW